MDKRFYRYQLFTKDDREWQEIKPDRAFGILQGSFGCVSPAIMDMVMNQAIIQTKVGMMRIHVNNGSDE